MSNKTVLVVEDEKPLSDAISLQLKKHGFDPVVARTIDQALGYVEDLPSIDIIWLDHYLLGDKNGIDLVAILKGDPTKKNIPIFLVSNTASADKVFNYMQLGVEKYYVKAEKRLEEIILDLKSYLNIS